MIKFHSCFNSFQDSKLSLYGRGKDGATLEELARSSSSLVPEFVKACVDYVEAEGLATEGLYRVPGSRAHVDLLMDCFRDGKLPGRLFVSWDSILYVKFQVVAILSLSILFSFSHFLKHSLLLLLLSHIYFRLRSCL